MTIFFSPDSYDRILIFVSSSIICVLIVCKITLYIRNSRERRLLLELKAAGLDKFEDGDPDRIDPGTAFRWMYGLPLNDG